MLLYFLKKGSKGVSSKIKNKIAKPYMRMVGSGLMEDIMNVSKNSGIKPMEILRNIKIKRNQIPKKYITFE